MQPSLSCMTPFWVNKAAVRDVFTSPACQERRWDMRAVSRFGGNSFPRRCRGSARSFSFLIWRSFKYVRSHASTFSAFANYHLRNLWGGGCFFRCRRARRRPRARTAKLEGPLSGAQLDIRAFFKCEITHYPDIFGIERSCPLGVMKFIFRVSRESLDAVA